MMTLAELLTRMVADGEWPVEGIEVGVVGLDDSPESEAIARAVAPDMLARLYDRIPGDVLHVERCGAGHWHVTVRDLGPRTSNARLD